MDNATHVLINSMDRDDYTNQSPSNFTVSLQATVKNCNSFSLAQLSIPLTFYNITATNNQFTINTNEYTLTPGCYNLNDLLQALANLVFANYPNMVFSYNDVSSQITISNNAIFSLKFSNWNFV